MVKKEEEKYRVINELIAKYQSVTAILLKK